MRSPDRWQHPTIPRSITAVRGPGELNRTPTCTGPHKRPIQRADRSTATRVASGETSENTWRATSQFTFCGSESPMDLSERSSKSGGIENTSLDTQTHPLRNEAQLQFRFVPRSIMNWGGELSRVKMNVA